MSSREELLAALETVAKANGITLDEVVPPHVGELGYVHPNNGKILLGVNLTLAIITVCVVLARFYTRIFVVGGVGGDDIMIGLAMVVVVGSTALNCYGVLRGGIGKHFYDLTTQQVSELLKVTYSLPIIYSLGVVMVKLSILLFYRRLFGTNSKLQRIVLYFIIFQSLFALGSIFGFAFICNPVSGWWRVEIRAAACPAFKPTTAIYVGLRAVTVICDIVVLCLPMKMVWALKIPARQRFGLAFLFAIGLIACVVAAVRLTLLPKLLMSLDVSWGVLPVALLDQAEQCLGIITASIPALMALVSRPRRRPASIELRKHDQQRSATPAGGNDYWSFAYDPDRQNVSCYAVAYAGSSDEQLVGVDGRIAKTTTVRVEVSRK